MQDIAEILDPYLILGIFWYLDISTVRLVSKFYSSVYRYYQLKECLDRVKTKQRLLSKNRDTTPRPSHYWDGRRHYRRQIGEERYLLEYLISKRKLTKIPLGNVNHVKNFQKFANVFQLEMSIFNLGDSLNSGTCSYDIIQNAGEHSTRLVRRFCPYCRGSIRNESSLKCRFCSNSSSVWNWRRNSICSVIYQAHILLIK